VLRGLSGSKAVLRRGVWEYEEIIGELEIIGCGSTAALPDVASGIDTLSLAGVPSASAMDLRAATTSLSLASTWLIS